MNHKYFVMRYRRGVGWVADGHPTCFKSARSQCDKIHSEWGRGRALIVKVVES